MLQLVGRLPNFFDFTPIAIMPTNHRILRQLDTLAASHAAADTPLSDSQRAQLDAELAQAQADAELQAAMQDTTLSLADYLAAVQLVIQETFAHSVWVKAEIRSHSSKGGHHYFELADKDANGKITASCRGNLWRGQAQRLLGKFERQTGRSLAQGLNVLFKVSASFHPQYGFAVTILDIDPTYTLGDLAQQYQAMLSRLQAAGLLTLNASVPTPFDIAHVLVIAPENAAGLGDFRADADRLMAAGACEFTYVHATFQGNHAPSEIRQAIITGRKALQAQGVTPDLLVIIRGGGAVGDLAYLNDYELAALVAEQPMPVWVGIGHERDRVLLDEVAHTRFDTPSKVIAGIVQHLYTTTQAAKQAFIHIQHTATQQLQQVKTDCQRQLMTTQHAAQQQLNHSRQQLDFALNTLKQAAYHQLTLAKQHSEQLRAVILLQHPASVLAKGYAIVRTADGHIITHAKHVAAHTNLTLQLQDGQLAVRVDDVALNQP